MQRGADLIKWRDDIRHHQVPLRKIAIALKITAQVLGLGERIGNLLA